MYYEDPDWDPNKYFYRELAWPLIKVSCESLAVFYSLKYFWIYLDKSDKEDTVTNATN